MSEAGKRLIGAAQEALGIARGWQPIETAPKDTPVLAYCNHEADPFYAGKHADGSMALTLYAAHYDGLGYAPTGFHIVEWGGAFDDSTWECEGPSLPDWWFVVGSDFEVAANPTHWMPLPEPPAGDNRQK
jgi:hypothetical protein